MTTIFVPSRFREQLACSSVVFSIETEPTIGYCRHMPILGYKAELKPGIDAVPQFGKGNCYSGFIVDDSAAIAFVMPMAMAENLELRGGVNIEINPESNFADPNLTHAVEQMREFIIRIALATGKKVTLHITKKITFEPYNDPDHIHIVLNSRVPGETSTQQIAVLGNVSLVRETSYNVSCAGPTKGRGRKVAFDGDFCIGQTVDTTLYLFIPDHTDSLPPYSHEYDNPFRIALAAVWLDYQTYKDTGEAISHIVDAESFSTGKQSDLAEMLRLASDIQIEKLQDMAAKLQQDLVEAYSRLRVELLMRPVVPTPKTVEELRAEWERIESCPYIESVTQNDKGTRDYYSAPVILVDDNGAEHDVGSFVVRLSAAHIHIWSTRITHPNRIAHPHISADNTICFGNVTSEIAKLCGEFRQIDAILLCFRWLFEGYEPSLTLHKLEEWPVFAPVTTAKELAHA